MSVDFAAIEAERARLHAEYVKADRPSSSARLELLADPLGEMYGSHVL